jgi:hypothetical protein
VPARLVAGQQLVAGVEVTAGKRTALANVIVRFEIASANAHAVVTTRDVPLSPDGPLSQFVRATLNLPEVGPGEYLARASIVADGALIGLIDAPIQLAK